MQKRCRRCDVTKDRSEFAPNTRYSNGLWCYCRACDAARAAERRALDPTKAQESARKSAEKHRDERNARRRERRAANPEATKAQRKADYEKYRERELATMRAWKSRNRAQVQKRQAERYWSEPEAGRARKNAYNRANPAATRAWRMARIAAKLSATPVWADQERIQLAYDAADLLMQVTGEWHEVDHIVPLRGAISRKPIVCGLHVDYNLQVIPKSENRRKSNSIWPDMPGKGY